MPTKRIYVDLDDTEQAEFAGALLFYKANPTQTPMRFVLSQKSRQRIIDLGAQFAIDVYPGTTPTPVPPQPDPTDPLARFNTAPSQWAKWHPGFFTPEEQGALLKQHPDWEAAIHQHINWFDGQGGYKLQGLRHADGSYWYLVPKTGPDPNGYYGTDEVPDINGAADAHILALISPRPMIAPLG